MDLSNIEGWSRKLLEAEAHKRGIRNPQVYTQGELVRIILRHEVQERGGPAGLRSAALRVASGLASAKGALGRLRRKSERPEEAGASERARDEPREILAQEPATQVPTTQVPTTQVHATYVSATRELPTRDLPTRDLPEAQASAGPADPSPELAAVGGERGQPPAPSPRPDEAAPARELAAASAHEGATASSQPAPSVRETGSGPADAARATAATFPPDDAQQISCDTRSTRGLQLRWRVTEAGVARARAVLGAPGELAVRVVAVRTETGARVSTEITDHGPVAASGDWLAPLQPRAARYVSSIGLRHGERFVSIAHRTA